VGIYNRLREQVMLFKLDVPLAEDPFADAATLAANGGLPWAIHKTIWFRRSDIMYCTCTEGY
jgi:hypothetical protein